MDIDFDELEKACGLIPPRIYLYERIQCTKDEIHEGVEKLKLIPLGEIEDAWYDTEDKIAEKFFDGYIKGEFDSEEIVDIREEFFEPYFKEHPDKKENWDIDEVVTFLQAHNRYEEYADAVRQCVSENDLIPGDELFDGCIIEVSEIFGLPVVIIDYLKENGFF
jgi:hypothetical protein